MSSSEGLVTPLSADTGPPLDAPPASALSRFRASASATVSAAIMPLVQRAGRAYMGGETVDDALTIARRLDEEGFPTTLGFWDTKEYSAQQVADICSGAIRSIASSGLDSYLSIKPPALRFDCALSAALARAAHARRVRVHCDSHGPEVAAASHEMEQSMLEHLEAGSLSTTLPGRWSRSLGDADWAIERGLRVRVVKGQWPDPEEPGRDPSAGYLEVIDRLAGRARHVGVATHDVPLAAEAIARLRAANTSFELELLYGMPMAPSLRWAKQERAPARIYVPFGKGFIPSAVGVLRRNPRLAWLVIKDLVTPSSA
jgi:proline dehydrogenase